MTLRVLHLLLAVREQSCGYNEFCLAAASRQEITVCSFFRPEIPVPASFALYQGEGSILGFHAALKAAFSSQRYDIVHAHSPHVATLFLASKVVRANGALPSVFTMHGSFENSTVGFRNRVLLLPILASFRRVVCVSEASRVSLPSPYRWLARHRTVVIPNGADLVRIDRTKEPSARAQREDDFTIAFVGRLIDIKNPLTVLRAFRLSASRGWRLVFVGEGNLKDRLQRLSRDLGLEDQVTFLGHVPREDVFRVLAAADLFVSASRGEGLPVAVLEAMGCRCPVILSDIAPHREIAAGTDFVPLIQADDVEGLSRELARFKKMTPRDRMRVGQQCRSHVEERFALATTHERYERLYLELLREAYRS